MAAVVLPLSIYSLDSVNLLRAVIKLTERIHCEDPIFPQAIIWYFSLWWSLSVVSWSESHICSRVWCLILANYLFLYLFLWSESSLNYLSETVWVFIGDFFVIFLVIKEGAARFCSSSSDKSDGVFHNSLLSESFYVDLRPVNPRGD